MVDLALKTTAHQARIGEDCLFPAQYRAPISSTIMTFMKVTSLVMLGFLGKAHLSLSSSPSILVYALCGLTGVSLYFVNQGRARITLFKDRVEKRTWFGQTSMPRHDVGSVSYGSFGCLNLVHRHNSGSRFIIPPGIKRDAVWEAWLSHVSKFPAKPSIFRRLLP